MNIGLKIIHLQGTFSNKLKFITLLFSLCISDFSYCQLIIKGTVYYKDKKLSGVTVSSDLEPSRTTRTTNSGTFAINSSGPGDRLVFSKRGYLTQFVTVNDAQQLVVQLRRATIKIFRRSHRMPRSKCPPSNPYCGCCFLPGTQILMKNGTQKNIETLKPGDLVMTANLSDFSLHSDTVRVIDSVVHHQLVELQLENGTTVTSTTDHPYYVCGKGWSSTDPELTSSNYGIRARKLQKGDSVKVYEEGKLANKKINALKYTEKETITYNISGLRSHNNYLANGILVSTEKEDKHFKKWQGKLFKMTHSVNP